MSGRLIILPKKSYTPWNAENVERVMKDERLHREKVQREEETQRKQTNVARIKMMKVRNRLAKGFTENGTGDTAARSEDFGGGGHNYEGISSWHEHTVKADEVSLDTRVVNSKRPMRQEPNLMHVNLFEEEEKKMIEAKVLGIEKTNYDPNTQEKQVGILPVFLTSSSQGRNNIHKNKKSWSSSNKEKEFYERDDCLKKNVDDKLKIRLDPMRQFNASNGIEESMEKIVAQDNLLHQQQQHTMPTSRKRDKESNLFYESSDDSTSSSSEHYDYRTLRSKKKSKKKKKKSKREKWKRQKNESPSHSDKRNHHHISRSTKKDSSKSKSGKY